MSDTAEHDTDVEQDEDEFDIEQEYSLADFVATLRRVADCLEKGEQFEVEFAGEKVSVPLRASYSIEHEIEDGEAELEFQIKWPIEDIDDEDEEEEDEEEAEKA
jgi:amphi-Trp domain-containing protein